MSRTLAALFSASSAALASLCFASPVTASPPSEPSCIYTLSPPQLVQVSGTTKVTATLAPFPCTGSINPNSMTVCVSAQGEEAAGECGFEAKPIAARVYVPYQPGTTYVSTGRGCGSVYTEEGSICSEVGPQTATL